MYDHTLFCVCKSPDQTRQSAQRLQMAEDGRLFFLSVSMYGLTIHIHFPDLYTNLYSYSLQTATHTIGLIQ